ncbi:helix-turn-helix domain-containing protein [Fulvivirgaceae bacterium BMA12]|uniref:Helix-turn-helix domain-containing protein n=1 Tax=Agaribacillus aureus TaxID=3051825 RepID=A0ABT8L8D3_9BACT|nr:helix-turn-helix domain-containing protein [Fulvivirgaceae bacterium BMA12]
MYLEFTEDKFNSIFRLTNELDQITSEHMLQNGLIAILWNRNSRDVTFYVDNIPITLKPGQITTSTYLQKVSFQGTGDSLTAFMFNRAFYCIQDHDHEVSCNGIIFFGTQDIPIITLDETEVKKIDSLYTVFIDEFGTKDNIQGEMLRMLLKRLIIMCTRIAKKQLITKDLSNSNIDMIRKFNVLVDTHFKTKKQVSDYADMLNKSPKTLSNYFLLYNKKSPLQIIHERIVLEARRLLTFTDMTAKEIAYELGFNDVTVFSKMFKKITGSPPSDFKKSQKVLN